MNRLVQYCFTCFFFFLLFLSPAQANALAQLEAFMTNTRSAKGEFTQMVSAVDGHGQSHHSRGYFTFLRPGKFVWKYSVPYQQEIWSDGRVVFFYTPDLHQVIQKSIDEVLSTSPAAILFGTKRLSDNFILKEDKTKNAISWLEVTPKMQQNVTQINDMAFKKIRLNMQRELPVEMELYDAFGQVTRLSFTHFDKNPTLAEDTFTFLVPPGVDVLY